MRAARLTVVVVAIALLAGCRAPARPPVGVPAGTQPIGVAPMIGLDGGTLVGLDPGTIEAKGVASPKAAPSAAAAPKLPAAVGCDLVAAMEGATTDHPAGEAIALSVDVAKGSTVAWAASSGTIMGSGGEAAWQPGTGADATITATVTTDEGAATLTWVAAVGKAGVKLAGPVVTACDATP